MRSTSSGSADSDVAVNAIRSQNSAVTTFRSSLRTGAAASGVAHSPQNFCPSGFSVPQEGQMAIAGDYAGMSFERNESTDASVVEGTTEAAGVGTGPGRR